jgi:hypothetical protein
LRINSLCHGTTAAGVIISILVPLRAPKSKPIPAANKISLPLQSKPTISKIKGGTTLEHAVRSSEHDVENNFRNCNKKPCCDLLLSKDDNLIKSVAEGTNCSFLSYELNAKQVTSIFSEPLQKFKGISFFREPLMHAFSAFQHYQTKHSKKACKSVADYLSRKRGCSMYSLYNMQTSIMGNASSTDHSADILSLAISRMENMFFVGITEHYSASICLLRYQLGQFHPLDCDCRNARKADGHIIPATINTATYDPKLSRYSVEELQLLRGLLELDYILYNRALLVFFARIAAAERALGVKLICGESDWSDLNNDAIRTYADAV